MLGGVSLAATAQAAEVPVVLCHSVGQGEELVLPKNVRSVPELAPADASALALYVSANHAVLAPRNWRCFENGGSSGIFLIVAPNEADVLAPPKGGITGPAVQITLTYAGTSGRFSAARIDARLFPEKKEFVQSVIDEGIEPASSFPTGPSLSDSLNRVEPGVVEFDTPPDHDGIGTDSSLAKGPLAIQGVAFLEKDGDGDIETLMIRLPPEQGALAKVVISDAEARLKRRRF